MELCSLFRLSYYRHVPLVMAGCLLLLLDAYAGSSQAQQPTMSHDLLQLQSDDNQWIMPAKNYART
jgi:hypothetical protein